MAAHIADIEEVREQLEHLAVRNTVEQVHPVDKQDEVDLVEDHMVVEDKLEDVVDILKNN